MLAILAGDEQVPRFLLREEQDLLRDWRWRAAMPGLSRRARILAANQSRTNRGPIMDEEDICEPSQ